MVYVLVFHRIAEPRAFWRIRERPDPTRPVHLRLVHALPSQDHKVLACLWESDSIETVRSYADRTYGSLGQNECYEIDEAEALGLHAAWHIVQALLPCGPARESQAEVGPLEITIPPDSGSQQHVNRIEQSAGSPILRASGQSRRAERDG